MANAQIEVAVPQGDLRNHYFLYITAREQWSARMGMGKEKILLQ